MCVMYRLPANRHNLIPLRLQYQGDASGAILTLLNHFSGCGIPLWCVVHTMLRTCRNGTTVFIPHAVHAAEHVLTMSMQSCGVVYQHLFYCKQARATAQLTSAQLLLHLYFQCLVISCCSDCFELLLLPAKLPESVKTDLQAF